ncbi:MAG: glycosyltransferase [Verrucomicrobiota bacterium]
MKPDCSLSYVLTTRNKLPFLREVMQRLLANAKPDEEVVAVDGGSTDGTVEYLRELANAGRIHQFISERDRGEAHGMNKAVLRARGECIKLISDDDAFFWRGIQECKQFMLGHPEVDAIASDGWMTDCTRPDHFAPGIHRHGYENYRDHGVEFEFSGLGLMLRRRSLALTGLFDPRFLRVDMEFALRLTSGPANLAWYAGYLWVRIQNDRSNGITAMQRVVEDTIKLRRYYGVVHRGATAAVIAEDAARALLRPWKQKLTRRALAEVEAAPQTYQFKEDWPAVFARCDAWLESKNREQPPQFLTRNRR